MRAVARRGLGRVIRECRERQGKDLDEVAKACGLSKSGLSQIERGLYAPIEDVLAALISYLKIPKSSKMAERYRDCRRSA